MSIVTDGKVVKISCISPPSPVDASQTVLVNGTAKDVNPVYLYYRDVADTSNTYVGIGGANQVTGDTWQGTIPGGTLHPNHQYVLRGSDAATATGAATSTAHGDFSMSTKRSSYRSWIISGSVLIILAIVSIILAFFWTGR